MLTNNYRRLHKMPMVHTKRYPHQSRFSKEYGFGSLSEWLEHIDYVFHELEASISRFANAADDWLKGATWQKSTF